MNPKLENQDPESIWEEGVWCPSGFATIYIPTLEEVFQFIKEHPQFTKHSFYCVAIAKEEYNHAILCANCRVLFCVYPFINLAKNRHSNPCCSDKCYKELFQ